MLNRLTGRAAKAEERQREADKRRALSKHAVYGSDEYALHEEAYDKEDYQRTSGQLQHKWNLYGQ